MGEDMKKHPGMFPANIEKVISKKWLSPEDNDQMDPHLFGLVKNSMNLFRL
jgi:hypothetical protein